MVTSQKLYQRILLLHLPTFVSLNGLFKAFLELVNLIQESFKNYDILERYMSFGHLSFNFRPFKVHVKLVIKYLSLTSFIFDFDKF